jgi:hypothetical protein
MHTSGTCQIAVVDGVDHQSQRLRQNGDAARAEMIFRETEIEDLERDGLSRGLAAQALRQAVRQIRLCGAEETEKRG